MVPASPTVEFDPDTEDWHFAGEMRSTDGGYALVITQRDLAKCTATDLARELRKAARLELSPAEVIIDTAPDDHYAPKDTVVGPVAFALADDGTLLTRLTFSGYTYMQDAAALDLALQPLVGPYLDRNRATIRSLEPDAYRTMAPYFHTISLGIPTRNRTLLDLYGIADSLECLLDAAQTGGLTRDTIADLVIGQHAHLLIGLPENSWLDVKSQHYDLSTPAGKISIAQAVSRFTNAEDGGVLVIGMSTKRRPGGEVIKAIQPVPLDSKTVRQYRRALEERLFPFPVGLRVEPVEIQPGEGLLVISMPPQPEELKPFLVHGAILNGKVEGAFISIVRRSGEDSIPITAAQIHSTLAAGRALLRSGQLPDVD